MLYCYIQLQGSKNNFAHKIKVCEFFVHAFLMSQNSNKRICSRQEWDPEDMSRAIISIRNGDCNPQNV
jgi:hypothetical protein